MSFAQYPETWTSARDRTVTARAPEVVDMYQDIIDRKKRSRILLRADEIDWKTTRNGVRTANLIDFRLGFQNSLVNIAISEIPALSEASDGHKHGEAYIYWLSGAGYSIVGDERVEWGPGDAMYVPPDTFHQHYNTSDEPARYLRVIPSPMLLNLLPLFASLSGFLTIEDNGPAA
jgi:uncharacterized RmlC-like cupin family protein